MPIRDWTKRPNALGRNTARVNLNGAVGQKLDLALNIGYINLNQRYTLESNATAGLGSQAFGGQGFKENGTVATTGTPLNGYRAWTPGYTWQEKTAQGVNRFIGSASGDVASVHLESDAHGLRHGPDGPRGRQLPVPRRRPADYDELPPRVQDQPAHGHPEHDARTSRAAETSTRLTWLNSRTTFGHAVRRYQLDQGQCSGTELPPGAQTCSSLIVPNADEATTLAKTLGFFVEQSVAIRDRLFLTAAVRTDQNSAFGTEFQSVWYPKLSASWLLSDEDFFPQVSWLNSLRFRTRVRRRGRAARPQRRAPHHLRERRRTSRAPTRRCSRTTRSATLHLKPERTTELEGGFELKLLNNRISFDLTGYQKRTKDALIIGHHRAVGRYAAPRTCCGTSAPCETAARDARQRPDRRSSSVRVRPDAQRLDEPQRAARPRRHAGADRHHRRRVTEGYPLFGWWARPITGYADKNGDGILTFDGLRPVLGERHGRVRDHDR